MSTALCDDSTGSVNGFSVAGETDKVECSEATGWAGFGKDFRDGGAGGLELEGGGPGGGAKLDVLAGLTDGLGCSGVLDRPRDFLVCNTALECLVAANDSFSFVSIRVNMVSLSGAGCSAAMNACILRLADWHRFANSRMRSF